MKTTHRKSPKVLGLLVILVILGSFSLGCDEDAAGLLPLASFNPNPNPTPTPSVSTSCEVTIDLAATFSDPSVSGTSLDETFIMFTENASLTTVSTTCAWPVFSVLDDFTFGIGRYVDPTNSNNNLFGIAIDEAVLEGTAATVSSSEISFTLQWGPETAYGYSQCSLELEISDGSLEEVFEATAPIALTEGGESFEASATIIGTVRSSNIQQCTGYLSPRAASEDEGVAKSLSSEVLKGIGDTDKVLPGYYDK